MTHLVYGDNLHVYGPQLDQMFALRRVETVRLSRPVSDAADADDDELAIYLMDIDAQGRVWGAVRLHPGRAGESGWRADRWLAPEGPAPDDDSILARLLVGLMEFCGARNLAAIAVDAEAGLLRRLGLLGCRLSRSEGSRPALDTGAAAREAVEQSLAADDLTAADRLTSHRLAARR